MFGRALLGANGDSGTPTPPTPVDLTQGLVAHYLLNNNADDIAGTYDGTPTSSVDFQGDMTYFNGTDATIDTPSPPLTDFVTGTHTISFWADGTSRCITFNKTTDTSSVMFHFEQDQMLVWLRGDNFATPQYIWIAGDFPNNHHIAATWNNSTVSVWIDGVLSADSIPITANPIGINKFRISGDQNTGGSQTSSSIVEYFFTGYISNIRIYNEVKDQTFIDALYAEGYYPKPLPLPTTDGLVAHYPLTGTEEDAHGEGGNESGTEFNGVAFIDSPFLKNEYVGSFDGVDDALRLGTIPVDDPLQLLGDFTICGWVNPSRTGDDIQRIIEKAIAPSAGGGYGITLGLDGTLKFYGTGLERLASVYKLPANAWTFFTITFENAIDDLYLYFDDNTTSDDFYGSYTGNPNTETTMSIGSWYQLSGREFKGELGDIRIYNRIITEAERLDLFNRTNESTTGLIAHWTLNNTPNDALGTYNGTEEGGVSYNIQGGSLASFDGVDDYISYPTTIKDALGATQTYTISFWVYVNSTEFAIMDTSAFTTAQHAMILRLDAVNRVSLRYYQPETADLWTWFYSPTLETGYRHITIINQGWDNNNRKMYVDGVEVTSSASRNDTNTAVDPVSSGSLSSGRTEGTWYQNPDIYYDGKLSDMRIYDKVLTATEITALYNEVDEPTDGLVAYYPLTKEARANDMWASYDGTDNGGLTYIDDTEFGSVANFDGINDYMSVDVGVIPSDWSISFWNNVASIALSKATIGLGRNPLTNEKYGFFFWNNSTLYRGDGVALTAQAAIVPSVNKFNHILIQKKGNIVQAYLNGVLDPDTLDVSTIAYSNTLLSVGMGYNSGYYPCTFRDVRFYNKALIAQEVIDIYNYEKNLRSIDIDDGLVAYYPLASNSLDNYLNQYDGVDTAMTYDGLSAIFDGTSGRIKTNDFMLDGFTETSIAFWVSLDTLVGDMAIVSRWTTDQALLLYHDDPLGWRMLINHTDFSDRAFDPGVVALSNTLYHISITFDTDGIFKLYIDGSFSVQQTTSPATITRTGSIDELNIGHDELTRLLDGKLSKVRIYNKAITAEQVAVIYNTEKGDFE